MNAASAARRGFSLGRQIAPPRFVVFLLLLPLGFFGYRHFLGGIGFGDPAAMGFDLAALVFIASLIPLLRDSDAETLRKHSEENDANRFGVLLITTLVTVVVMSAIAGELPNASQGNHLSMIKLIGTLALTWLFANIVYAMHYAHLFYSKDEKSGGDMGGLDIPGCDCPDYLDFLYFSFTLGMTFQTSDTQITGRSIRRIVILHSMAAFVFNIGVIAFTINALGGGK
ncbi:DUF1345 domain-containing protein [Novosphingobium lentum]|uniref:DUF1345 domain-containing protein n=1 Tax=Novosphingobium lentum TaxID=145287 RepID=UPI00082FA808|nr:DUF1345 domain-containing protein [Novosphingobium lentum]